MHIKESLRSQYHASLEMLKNAVSTCDQETWLTREYKHYFWHLAYHSLFYVDFYLSKDEKSFVPWEKHRKEYQFLGEVPWRPGVKPEIDTPYTQPEILEYLDDIQRSLEGRLEEVHLDDPSGFCWLPIDKLALNIYNIRHLAHHTGQLIERLRERRGIGIEWVAKAPK